MANCINIGSFEPAVDEVYFVDANVWYWFSGGGVSGVSCSNYQLKAYPRFIDKILRNRARLKHTSLTFSEIANIIEREECKRFNEDHGTQLGRKELRKLEGFRDIVIAEVESAWAQIEGVSECIVVDIGERCAASAKSFFVNYPLDSYDAMYMALVRQQAIVRVISDDGDFSSVDGISLFTANRAALASK